MRVLLNPAVSAWTPPKEFVGVQGVYIPTDSEASDSDEADKSEDSKNSDPKDASEDPKADT